MITYWQQQTGGKLVKVKDEEIDAHARIWVDARIVTRDDVEQLQENYGIDPEHILDILDPDELSRLEDGDDYVLTILRLPIFEPSAETPYFTIPLGIILKDNVIITICWTDCEVLRDFATGRAKGIVLADFPAFIMRIIGRSNITFLRYLKEINRRSTAIQNELQLSIENKEIIQLLSLEKSLVYFTTSLKSNQLDDGHDAAVQHRAGHAHAHAFHLSGGKAFFLHLALHGSGQIFQNVFTGVGGVGGNFPLFQQLAGGLEQADLSGGTAQIDAECVFLHNLIYPFASTMSSTSFRRA